MFKLKKKFNKSSLVLYLSFILVTWSLLQISLTDFFENNDYILIKIPLIYAQDYGDENGNGKVSYDNWGNDIQKQSLDKEDTQDKYVAQDDVPGELTLSEDSQNGSVDISKLIDTVSSGTDITSQLPSGDPQPLLVGLPPIPGGSLPPGGLPPIPGNPLPPGSPIPPGGLPPIPGNRLPPGSPIPPGGGPTPPEELL